MTQDLKKMYKTMMDDHFPSQMTISFVDQTLVYRKRAWKLPDEKFVTERAYQNPMFVEDIVRDIAQKLNTDPNITWFAVESENYESIHNHNAYAYIEKHKT